MFCYVVNYILWILGAFICSVIKCFTFEPKKDENKRWQYIVGLVLVQLPVFTIKYVYTDIPIVRYVCLLLIPILYVVYLKAFFEGYLWQMVLLVIFEVCCNFIAEMMTLIILSDALYQIGNFNFEKPIAIVYLSILYIIVSILFLLVSMVFKRFILKGKLKLNVFYIFSIFPISQIILMLSVNQKIYEDIITPSGISLVFGSILAIMADIVLLITLLRQQRMQELAIKINEMEKTWEVEQIHYADIEARREDLAKIRHDLSEQFLVIRDLLHKKEYDKVEEMVDVLTENVAGTREYVYCGDSVVNAIMAENERKCQEYGIRFDYDLHITNSLHLNPVVVCSVFSNLLRNAIAAACGTKDMTEAFVLVKADVNGDYLHIKVENSYSEMSKKSKEDRKGYGLSILQALADQYSGYMEQKSKDGIYSVYMVVENIEDK